MHSLQFMGCLLDYNYFKKHKMIAIDLSKQKSTWCCSKSNTTWSGKNNRLMFFIIEEAKETTLDFSKATVKVL